MNRQNNVGAPFPNGAPCVQAEAGLASTFNSNSSVFKEIRKSPLSGSWNHPDIKAQLQNYLNLGLTPIPLKGKRPIVRWVHGDWHPKKIDDLAPYKNCVNWGIKTSATFAVIDFDDEHAFFQFAEANAENLPKNTPLVKTGRGFHIWLRPTQPLKDQHFIGLDLKGIGGMVCAPPSIHPRTNRRYKFIWPIEGNIPEVDVSKLKFPELKRKSNESSSSKKSIAGCYKESSNANAGNINGTLGLPIDKPRFDYELIRDGVDEGGRHNALVSYVGRLIWQGMSLEEARVLVTDWNLRNKPPLPKDELESTLVYLYKAYSKENLQNKNDVPIKTLNIFNSVLNETQKSSYINHDLSQRSSKSVKPNPAHEPVSPWETEDTTLFPYQDCGKKRAILRRGREFVSVSFFCGRWDCPRCGPFFRQRWIEHILTKTEGMGLYVTEINALDWPKIRRSINRLETDYLKIKSGMIYKLITDKPLRDSKELKPDEVKSYFESAIPDTAPQCPISTSRGWRREKVAKPDSGYEPVARTWLPVKDQVEIVKDLGGTIVKHARWVSPKDADEDEWTSRFKYELRKRERLITWWLEHDLYGGDMQDYLNREYAEDAVNDENKDESFLERQLLEVG
jgi:hypothetical protein